MRVMSLLSDTFQRTRMLVVFALLLGVNAPLVQFACGTTGEALTSSTLALVINEVDAEISRCGTVSGGVHDQLCTESNASPICQGVSCTTDTVEKHAVVVKEASTDRWSVESSLRSERDASPQLDLSSFSTTGPNWSTRGPDRIPVRLRTSSFRL